LESFDGCASAGCDAIELDIRYSSDNVPLAFHDETLDRTTNQTGKVELYTLAELKALDAGYRFTQDGVTYPYRGKGVVIPTLKEICENTDIDLNIDIKIHTEQAVDIFVSTLRSIPGCFERVVAGSFDDKTTQYLQQIAPDIKTFGSVRETVEFTLKYYAGRPEEHIPESQYFAVPVGYVLDNESYIKAANNNGQGVMYWTINNLNQMERLLLDGADGIITDDVVGAVEVFRRLGYKP